LTDPKTHDNNVIERTEVLYGTDNVINNELRFFSEAKTRIDTCMDYSRPALAIGIEAIRKSFLEAKRKCVYLRYLTEITNDNLSYWTSYNESLVRRGEVILDFDIIDGWYVELVQSVSQSVCSKV